LNGVNKDRFADRVFDEVGLNKCEAKDMVELFFEDIKETLEQGEPVKLSGFGNFGLRDKGSRPGRTPKHAKRRRSPPGVW
jgi:integration host factor subunit alpha